MKINDSYFKFFGTLAVCWGLASPSYSRDGIVIIPKSTPHSLMRGKNINVVKKKSTKKGVKSKIRKKNKRRFLGKSLKSKSNSTSKLEIKTKLLRHTPAKKQKLLNAEKLRLASLAPARANYVAAAKSNKVTKSSVTTNKSKPLNQVTKNPKPINPHKNVVVQNKSTPIVKTKPLQIPVRMIQPGKYIDELLDSSTSISLWNWTRIRQIAKELISSRLVHLDAPSCPVAKFMASDQTACKTIVETAKRIEGYQRSYPTLSVKDAHFIDPFMSSFKSKSSGWLYGDEQNFCLLAALKKAVDANPDIATFDEGLKHLETLMKSCGRKLNAVYTDAGRDIFIQDRVIKVMRLSKQVEATHPGYGRMIKLFDATLARYDCDWNLQHYSQAPQREILDKTIINMIRGGRIAGVYVPDNADDFAAYKLQGEQLLKDGFAKIQAVQTRLGGSLEEACKFQDFVSMCHTYVPLRMSDVQYEALYRSMRTHVGAGRTMDDLTQMMIHSAQSGALAGSKWPDLTHTAVDFDPFWGRIIPLRDLQQRFGLNLIDAIEFIAFRSCCIGKFGVTTDAQALRLYQNVKVRLSGGLTFQQTSNFICKIFDSLECEEVDFPDLAMTPHANFDRFLNKVFPVLLQSQVVDDRNTFFRNIFRGWEHIPEAPIRVIELFNRFFDLEAVRVINGMEHASLPSNRVEQKRIVRMAIDLLNRNILVPALPAFTSATNLNAYLIQAEATLKRASQFVKTMNKYHMSFDAAHHYIKFLNMFAQETDFAKMPEEKKHGLYQSLKNSTGDQFDNVCTFFFDRIAQSVMRIDLPHWPDNNNFDLLVNNTIQPTYQAMLAAHDQDVFMENTTQGWIGNSDRRFIVLLRNKTIECTHQSALYSTTQLVEYGSKESTRTTTFKQDTEDAISLIDRLDQENRSNPLLAMIPNLKKLYSDPYMVLIRKPDETLNRLYQGLGGSLQQEITTFKDMVFANMPDRLDDNSAFSSFMKFVPILQEDVQNYQVTYRTGVARLKRLYQAIEADSSTEQAARILYTFAAENAGRCINGLGGRLTDLEKQYVYKVGSAEDRDLTIDAAMRLSNIFMNHRMHCLRETIDRLFTAGEPRTYGWFRTHRSLLLSMNLPGTYLPQPCGDIFRRYELSRPLTFIEKYIRGGDVEYKPYELPYRHALSEFNYTSMIRILREDILKGAESVLDDDVLMHLVHSDSTLRSAYQRCQDDCVENDYFTYDATRRSIKDKAIGRILHRYGWTLERQEDDGAWL